MSTESLIKERIQSFASELELIVKRSVLSTIRETLEGRPAPARRPGKPAGTDTGNLPEKIASTVRATPGQTVGQIVAATGARSATVKATIKRMLHAGELRKTGERRGTRYFPRGAGRLPGTPNKTKGRRRAAKKTARKVRPSATIKPARRLAKGATRRTVLVPAGAIARPATTDVPEALAAR